MITCIKMSQQKLCIFLEPVLACRNILLQMPQFFFGNPFLPNISGCHLLSILPDKAHQNHNCTNINVTWTLFGHSRSELTNKSEHTHQFPVDQLSVDATIKSLYKQILLLTELLMQFFNLFIISHIPPTETS